MYGRARFYISLICLAGFSIHLLILPKFIYWPLLLTAGKDQPTAAAILRRFPDNSPRHIYKATGNGQREEANNSRCQANERSVGIDNSYIAQVSQAKQANNPFSQRKPSKHPGGITETPCKRTGRGGEAPCHRSCDKIVATFPVHIWRFSIKWILGVNFANCVSL